MQDPSKVYNELLSTKDRFQKGYLANVLYDKSFSLQVNSVRAFYPVRHKECQSITQDKHICGCLDQILKGQNLKCGTLSLTNINDLVAAKDHYEVIQQFNFNTKEVSIFKGDAFNKMVRIDRYIKLLSDKSIQNIYQQVKIRNDIQNNISEKIKKHPKYRKFDSLEFYAACHLDFVKLIIPMRFRACKHMECFDFTTISYKLDTEIKNKTTGRIICGIETDGQFCDSWCYADYDSMIAELVLDQELLQLLKKAETFNQKFIYQNGKVQDLLTFQEQQLQLNKKQLTENQKQAKINQQSVHEHLNSIVNLKQSEKAQKIIQKYKNFKINRKCPLSGNNNLFGQNLLIEFPGRCIHCIEPQCADLRNLIDNLLLFKKDHQEKFYKCPLCGHEWNKQRAVNLQPASVFYFDETIMGLIIQNQDLNNCDKESIDYQGKTTLLNEYKKSYKISREQVSDTYPSGWVTYRSIKCIVSDTILKNPLKIRNCKQESRVSFDAFFTKFEKQNYKLDKDNPIKLCKCYDCQQEIGIISFYELAFDEVMNEMLTTVKNISDYASVYIKYNLNSKLIDQAKYNGIKILYPNTGRGHLSVMNDAEYEEYCKQFEETNFQGYNLKMDGYKFKQGNLEFQFDQNGVQFQGGQEFFNQENEIKKKYAIEIQQITFKPNQELLGLKGQVTLESKQFK